MMKLYLLIILFIYTLAGFAQNKYQLSIGSSIPDNISNKYLKTGIYSDYGIEFKLSNYISVNTYISITYNTKNSNYRFGFDDEPYFIYHPEEKEIEEDFRIMTDYYAGVQLYLFNPSLGLEIKYNIIQTKNISPYLFAGFNGNYSLYKDPIEVYEFDNNNLISTFVYSTDLLHKFNIGYHCGIGVGYSFKNNKSIFIESTYKIIPSVKFGMNEDRAAFFYINAGISLPFSM